jgi:O-succinylbenzoate synthase
VALAAALPELPYACGLATMSLLAGDVTGEPLAESGGELPVRRPAVDPDALARWEADPGPWRERALAAARYLPAEVSGPAGVSGQADNSKWRASRGSARS